MNMHPECLTHGQGFIYEPFPVESSLHEQLTDHLNAEIVAKTIRTLGDHCPGVSHCERRDGT